MNWNQVQGNWKQFTGKVKEKWGELTDDEIDQIAGNATFSLGIHKRKPKGKSRTGRGPRLIVGIF